MEYVSIASDFGFNKFMSNDEVVIRFINSVLPAEDQIVNISSRTRRMHSAPVSLAEAGPSVSTRLAGKRSRISEPESLITRMPQEDFNNLPTDKSVRYDLLCKTKDGRIINIEMQKASQEYYFHRALYYSSKIISSQGWAGQSGIDPISEKKQLTTWKWDLTPVYHIGILGFPLKESMHAEISAAEENCYLLWSQLAIAGDKCIPEVATRIQSNLLNIILISLPTFKAQTEIINDLQEFIWLFKNIGVKSIQLPEWARFKFGEFLEGLKVNSLSVSEHSEYETELLGIRNVNETIGTAFKEGKIEGKIEGKDEVKAILKLLRPLESQNLPNSEIKRQLLLKFPNNESDIDDMLID